MNLLQALPMKQGWAFLDRKQPWARSMFIERWASNSALGTCWFGGTPVLLASPM